MGLREQIGEIVGSWLEENDDKTNYEIAESILFLPLDGWIAEEKCCQEHDIYGNKLEEHKDGGKRYVNCLCQGTGIITRPALLSDLEREDVRLRRKDK